MIKINPIKKEKGEEIMNKQRILHDFMQRELQRYEKLYYKMKKEVELLPQGSLAIDKQGHLCRCLREEEHQYKLILSSDEKDLFLDLKKRRYITKGLKVLKARIENCRRFLERDQIYDPKQIEKILPRQYRGTSRLDIFLDGDFDPQDWARQPYRRNPVPIQIPHYTAGGVIVRSKSEAMIGTRLEERNAIFRPEPEVRLKWRSVYPDFETINVKRRKIMYLEHLGRIDDEDYVFRNLGKLQYYAECGIVLGDNLFITYESQSKPLQIQDIDVALDEMLG